MDYKTNLRIALQHLEQAETANPKLSSIINEVARAYKGRPKIRKKQDKQLDFLLEKAASPLIKNARR